MIILIILCLGRLGSSLQGRFERLGEIADLHEAITVQEQAVGLTPDGHPGKSQCFNNLGASLRTWLRHQPDDVTLGRAISAYSQSANSSHCPPFVHFTAARMWATLSSSVHSREALDAYSTLISLIPHIVWLGRTVEQRYEDISSIGDAVSDAAASAISFGETGLALEWLGLGRSILWGQDLQLRAPADALRQHHPNEVDVLEELSRALGSTCTVQAPDHSTHSTPDESKSPEEAAQYEGIVKHLRSLPGFAEFLQPKKSAPLCSVAVSGPVVIVNAHKTRSDALVLLPLSSQVHVALPGLQVSDLSRMQLCKV